MSRPILFRGDKLSCGHLSLSLAKYENANRCGGYQCNINNLLVYVSRGNRLFFPPLIIKLFLQHFHLSVLPLLMRVTWLGLDALVTILAQAPSPRAHMPHAQITTINCFIYILFYTIMMNSIIVLMGASLL